MKLKAFTMAEAILTMTILGIIATIMISTLKPAEYREKGLQILAKKVMGEIDDATTQILINNSRYGNMSMLHQAGGTTTFSMTSNATTNAGYLGTLYKNYISSTRTSCVTTTSECPCGSYSNRFWLKDGACIGINGTSSTVVKTWFPGETTSVRVSAPYGRIFFDINGADDPNVLGQDQFLMPFSPSGIDYEGSMVAVKRGTARMSYGSEANCLSSCPSVCTGRGETTVGCFDWEAAGPGYYQCYCEAK